MLVDGAAETTLVVGVVQCPPLYTIITGCFSIQIFIDFDTYLLRYLSMSFKKDYVFGNLYLHVLEHPVFEQKPSKAIVSCRVTCFSLLLSFKRLQNKTAAN